MTDVKSSYVTGWTKESAGTIGEPSSDPGNGAFTALLVGDTSYKFGEITEDAEGLKMKIQITKLTR